MRHAPVPGGLMTARLRAITRVLPRAVAGDVGAIHRARVASRRLREALPIIAAALPSARLKKPARTIRHLTRALGSVRQLDVTLGLLDEVTAAREPDEPVRPGVERLRQSLRKAREEAHAEMTERLSSLKLERVARQIAERADAHGAERVNGWRTIVLGHVARRAERAHAAIVAAGALYLPDRLHAVRIALKTFRYALELADATGVAHTKRAVRLLRQAQDTLGRLHDLEVLADSIQQLEPAGNSLDAAVSEDLAGLLRGTEADCRHLHGRYVKRCPLLIGVCETFTRRSSRRLRLPARSDISLAAR